MESRPFSQRYRCYPAAMLPGNRERTDIENGGKIILPPSVLQHLTIHQVVYPLLFRLTNRTTGRMTHCGVLEFVADPGRCYIPHWMMMNLDLFEGGTVQVETALLPVASFSKFEPQSVEFLDITNPKAMLENALRSFACLTTGDIIAIKYNDKLYELKVLETKPGIAVSIIECDMDVEFAPPVGYVEPESQRKNEMVTPDEPEGSYGNENSFAPFAGTGYRLDGKSENTVTQPGIVNHKRGIPDYDTYKNVFSLKFWHGYKKPDLKKDEDTKKELTPFSGIGNTLKPRDRN